MKKVFQTIFVVLSFLVIICFTTVNKSEAAITSTSQVSEFKNNGVTIIRTIENGVRYISIYINEGILVMKIEEL